MRVYRHSPSGRRTRVAYPPQTTEDLALLQALDFAWFDQNPHETWRLRWAHPLELTLGCPPDAMALVERDGDVVRTTLIGIDPRTI